MAQPELVKDIEARVKKSGDTMTGNLIGQYFQGTWLQTSQAADLGKSPSRIAVIRDDGWLYYRTPSELASDIGLTGNYILKSGDTMTGQLVFNNNTSNQNSYPSIKWGTIQSNTPFIGYATDQKDGTFIITSLKGTTYATGLAIGGSSQNLLYKGQIVLNASNFNQYAPSLTGSGASGTWSININGNATSATKATQDGNGAVISSTYLPLAGGTLTGALTINNTLTVNSAQCSINYGVAQYCSNMKNIQATQGLNICQGFNETSGIQFNGDYIMMWSPADSYTIRYFDEDSGNEVWNINSSGVFSGSVKQVYLNGTTTSTLYLYGSTTTTAGNKNLYTNSSVYISSNVLYGAAWNDYAEYRESNITQPGRCIVENGDDTLSLSTERLQRGAEIVSDTFGFAIGETDTCKTPIAASGRVLAYGYEDREQFKSHIGYPVCSGPNGTVSIMTNEEEQLYPSRIIGYISAVPDYEIWGTGNVKVDGRIWIRIK